jgi:hypothetical protein
VAACIRHSFGISCLALLSVPSPSLLATVLCSCSLCGKEPSSSVSQIRPHLHEHMCEDMMFGSVLCSDVIRIQCCSAHVHCAPSRALRPCSMHYSVALSMLPAWPDPATASCVFTESVQRGYIQPTSIHRLYCEYMSECIQGVLTRAAAPALTAPECSVRHTAPALCCHSLHHTAAHQ